MHTPCPRAVPEVPDHQPAEQRERGRLPAQLHQQHRGDVMQSLVVVNLKLLLLLFQARVVTMHLKLLLLQARIVQMLRPRLVFRLL